MVLSEKESTRLKLRGKEKTYGSIEDCLKSIEIVSGAKALKHTRNTRKT